MFDKSLSFINFKEGLIQYWSRMEQIKDFQHASWLHFTQDFFSVLHAYLL